MISLGISETNHTRLSRRSAPLLRFYPGVFGQEVLRASPELMLVLVTSTWNAVIDWQAGHSSFPRGLSSRLAMHPLTLHGVCLTDSVSGTWTCTSPAGLCEERSQGRDREMLEPGFARCHTRDLWASGCLGRGSPMKSVKLKIRQRT